MKAVVHALPMAAELLLPHRSPMCCIDSLVACTETTATGQVSLREGYIFLKNGSLEPLAHIELAAQTAGAMMGYCTLLAGGKPQVGYLVGVNDFFFFANAVKDDVLTIQVDVVSKFEHVTVIDATIHGGVTLLAQGTLKVFLPGANLLEEV